MAWGQDDREVSELVELTDLDSQRLGPGTPFFPPCQDLSAAV